MDRPRLFLSAVSEELRSARKNVSATVRTLGFDPISQDDFSTGYGELRQWLKEQIDSCEGLIQLVGDGYGAEPPETDSDYGRVSYTQFEFRYACSQRKKTWIIIIRDDCTRDKSIDQLDLPSDTKHPDPVGFQSERRKLQQDYIDGIHVENHLRHYAESDLELENIILRLRDELEEIHQRWEKFRTDTTHSLEEIKEAVRLTTDKIRSHLLQTADETHRRELAEADIPNDWKERQRLCEAADIAHTARLSRVEDLAAIIAEIEGSDKSSSVFKEMTRILTEQGVDEAIAYVSAQRPSILKTVRARAIAARERNRTDLQPLLKTASLYETKGLVAEARSLYNEVLEIDPGWTKALHAAYWFHSDQGGISLVRRTLNDANEDYEKAHRIAKRLNAIDSSNIQWQHNLAVTYGHLGEVAMDGGNLDEAADAWGEAVDILKNPVNADLSDIGWQRDLASIYVRLGDLAVAQGKLEAAASAYDDSLEIRDIIVDTDRYSKRSWGDLSISYGKLGDLAVAQGKLEEAADAYGKVLEIFKVLNGPKTSNTEWQYNLSVSYSKVGDVAVARGKLEKAASAYEESLVIVEKLAAEDPNHIELQHGLSVSYERLGHLAAAQGKLGKATSAFDEALKIRKNQADADPSNTRWQHSQCVLYQSLADLAQRQNKITKAKKNWKSAFDVLSGMKKRGLYLSPSNQRDLETLRKKAGLGNP
jgi:tetratricopeptide (TPR) repeat protein